MAEDNKTSDPKPASDKPAKAPVAGKSEKSDVAKPSPQHQQVSTADETAAAPAPAPAAPAPSAQSTRPPMPPAAAPEANPQHH